MPSSVPDDILDFLDGLSDYLEQRKKKRLQMNNHLAPPDMMESEKYYQDVETLVKFAVRKYFIEYHIARDAIMEAFSKDNSLAAKNKNIYIA